MLHPNHKLAKRSLQNKLGESYFYVRELSSAIGTGISRHLHEFYLDNTFKIAIFNASESKGSTAIPNMFYAEVSIFIKDYVRTDALIEGLLHLYGGNESQFSIRVNTDKLHSAQIVRLEESDSPGTYVSPITGKPMTPIYESEAALYNTDDEDIDYFAQCRGSAIITPFINCPHVRLEPSSFSWCSNGTGILINELNLYIENAMFRRNNGSVLICHDTFMKAVERTLSNNGHKEKTIYHAAEGVISFTLSCISVICLLLTLLTFILFPVLRTQPGLNNMFLSLFFIGAYLALVFKASQTDSDIGCTILGGIVHFCWVLVFFWMNVCSIHMFRVFTSLGKMPSRISFCLTLKYLIYSIISTAVMMGINVVVSIYVSNGETYGYGLTNNNLCYIHYPLMVLVTMAVPANVIVLSNLIMFFIISMKIRNSSKIQKHTQKDRNYFIIYARLSTVTGLTWLSSIPTILTGSTVFAYIFSVLNCSQGIFIFIAFICNKRVFNLYRNLITSGGLTANSNYETNESTVTLPSSQCSSISVRKTSDSTEKLNNNDNTKALPSGQCNSISVWNASDSSDKFGNNLNCSMTSNNSYIQNDGESTSGTVRVKDNSEVFDTKL